MPNDRTRLPLPRSGPLGLIQYAGVDMHAYSDAECVPLMAEIEALRQDGSKMAADNAALRERIKVLTKLVDASGGGVDVDGVNWFALRDAARAALEAK